MKGANVKGSAVAKSYREGAARLPTISATRVSKVAAARISDAVTPILVLFLAMFFSRKCVEHKGKKGDRTVDSPEHAHY